MQEAATFSPEEQKYFDTKGADGPANDGTPVQEQPEAEPEAQAQPEKEGEQEQERNNAGQFIRRADFEKLEQHKNNLDKALREHRIQAAEKTARLEERLNTLQQLFQRPEPEPQPVDPRTDLPGFLHQQSRQLEELNQWKQQSEAERQQQIEVSRQYQELKAAVETHEAEFSQTTPDYFEAIDFARQARDRELQILGVRDARERAAILEDTIVRASAFALQRGENPAEMFYKYALERGYKAQAQQQKPNSDAEKLKRIAEGQNAGKSLGAANGSATPALTLENLANMSDDEFKQVALDKKQWRKLMGG